MRNILWILVAVVIAAGAYWLYTGQSPQDLATEVEEPETAPEADAVVDEPTGDTATDTMPEAEEPASDLTDEAATEEEPATDATEEAATEEEPAANVTDEATAEEAPAANDATAGEEPVVGTDAETDTTATDSPGSDAAGTATDTAAAEDPQELLTVDGFDFERVNGLIENSDLDPAQKTELSTALEEAQDSPELLADVLERIREALNL